VAEGECKKYTNYETNPLVNMRIYKGLSRRVSKTGRGRCGAGVDDGTSNGRVAVRPYREIRMRRVIDVIRSRVRRPSGLETTEFVC
jgi:hypothetical protein